MKSKNSNKDIKRDAIKQFQDNCKHDKGYITNTIDGTKCASCGKPWTGSENMAKGSTVNRVLKFVRAHFDRDNKFEQFTYWGFIGGKWMPPMESKYRFEDCQYIGRLDMKGNELHAGCIVSLEGRYGGEYWDVTWNEKGAGFEFVVRGMEYDTEFISNVRQDEILIVGNIYENNSEFLNDPRN